MGGLAVELIRGGILHPYYVLHLVSLVSYFVLRFFALPSVSPYSQAAFLRWEAQAVLSLALVLVVKFARMNTLEGFISDALVYGKCMLAFLVAILDPRILVWYLFTFAVMFLLWNQPTYMGSDNVTALTPLQLETQLLENRNSAWLVEFGADSSPQCSRFNRIFADLSLKYSTPTFHFGKVDVGRFPKTASKYGIEFGVALRQLPTLVLFEGGVEFSRLSQSTSDATAIAPTLTEGMVVRHFELDLLLIRALSRKAVPVSGESLGK